LQFFDRCLFISGDVFMKRFLLGLTGVVGLVASAAAADLPARTWTKAAAIDPSYNWTGFYAGVNAGGAWGHSDVATSTIFDPVNNAGYFIDANTTALFNTVGRQRTSTSGFTGGIQAGYNWQSGHFVAGVETDFQSFRQSGSATATALYPTLGTPFTISHSVSTDWLWTLRPRVGIASNDWLFYATGGLALTKLNASSLFIDSFGDTAATSWSQARLGWTVGAGVEHALKNGWSVKAEYLYVDFGNVGVTTHNILDSGVAPVPGQPLFHSVNLRSNIARVGLNYNFGAAAAAKY
jgi:outer membrane immunogenic protein